VFSGTRLLDWISDHMLLVAITTAGLLCIGCLAIYDNHPLSMDEYAVYFQSQVFAAGRLTGSFPVALVDWLIPPNFQNYFFSVSKDTGRIASAYWPSFSLLLAPFTALKISWACNPVISGLTLLAVHRLALTIYADRGAASLAVLLTLASPEFFINGITYFSMPAHLLANMVYALLLINPTRAKALLAGLIGSIALTLHNPFPHLMFSLPWILWIAGRRDAARLILCLAAGYLPLCLLFGLGWLSLMGDLRQAGINSSSKGGLISMLPAMSVFSLPDSTVVLARLMGFAKIWLWSVPGLLVLAVAGARKGAAQPALRLLTASMLLTLFGYFLVPVDQSYGWGYRYFHTAWCVLPLLAAGALTTTGVTRRVSSYEDAGVRSFVVACAALTLMLSGAQRVLQVHKFVSDHLSQLPAYPGKERRIVLVDANKAFYGRDLIQNDPWLRGDVVRMLSHGQDSDARMMLQYFPDLREAYSDVHGSVWALPVSR
jgi:hypothetical protein